MQIFILVVFIYVTKPISELTNLMENIHTKNSSIDNACCIFEDNYIFWIILILHPGHISLSLETVTTKFGGPRDDM